LINALKILISKADKTADEHLIRYHNRFIFIFLYKEYILYLPAGTINFMNTKYEAVIGLGSRQRRDSKFFADVQLSLVMIPTVRVRFA
jgi:hypothetical protein